MAREMPIAVARKNPNTAVFAVKAREVRIWSRLDQVNETDGDDALRRRQQEATSGRQQQVADAVPQPEYNGQHAQRWPECAAQTVAPRPRSLCFRNLPVNSNFRVNGYRPVNG